MQALEGGDVGGAETGVDGLQQGLAGMAGFALGALALGGFALAGLVQGPTQAGGAGPAQQEARQVGRAVGFGEVGPAHGRTPRRGARKRAQRSGSGM